MLGVAEKDARRSLEGLCEKWKPKPQRLNRLRKNATKLRKSFLQGLKPVESKHFTSELKESV
jgi:hypothetical protein